MILGLKKPRHSPIQVETDTILEFVMAYIRTEQKFILHRTCLHFQWIPFVRNHYIWVTEEKRKIEMEAREISE